MTDDEDSTQVDSSVSTDALPVQLIPPLSPDSMQPNLSNLTNAQVLTYVSTQLQILTEKYNSVKEQVDAAKNEESLNNIEIVRRVERLTALMTNYMACVKQLAELLDTYGDKLNQHDKDDSRRDAAQASMVDRQNRFSSSLAKLTKSGKEIVDEIETLKQRLDDQDKFHWKIVCVFTIVATAVYWLFAGDNLAKIIVAINGLTGSN